MIYTSIIGKNIRDFFIFKIYISELIQNFNSVFNINSYKWDKIKLVALAFRIIALSWSSLVIRLPKMIIRYLMSGFNLMQRCTFFGRYQTNIFVTRFGSFMWWALYFSLGLFCFMQISLSCRAGQVLVDLFIDNSILP